MKLKILMLCAAISSSYAGIQTDYHFHSLVEKKNLGYCEIEIVNNSSLFATVYGTFDDGTPLIPFNIMPDSLPQYVNLFYQGYCHPNMYLDIVDANGLHIYTKYTLVGTKIKLTS